MHRARTLRSNMASTTSCFWSRSRLRKRRLFEIALAIRPLASSLQTNTQYIEETAHRRHTSWR